MTMYAGQAGMGEMAHRHAIAYMTPGILPSRLGSLSVGQPYSETGMRTMFFVCMANASGSLLACQPSRDIISTGAEPLQPAVAPLERHHFIIDEDCLLM